jgi:hypothetical protein
MNDRVVAQYQKRLAEKLAETLQAPLPVATPRRVYGVVSLPNKATAVIGVRRAGKTTFLHQLRRERLEQGVARERLVDVNFEDEQLTGLQAGQLNSLMEEYYRQFPAFRQKERVSLFFDEMQQVPGLFGGLFFSPDSLAGSRFGTATDGESTQGLSGGPWPHPGV